MKTLSKFAFVAVLTAVASANSFAAVPPSRSTEGWSCSSDGMSQYGRVFVGLQKYTNGPAVVAFEDANGREIARTINVIVKPQGQVLTYRGRGFELEIIQEKWARTPGYDARLQFVSGNIRMTETMNCVSAQKRPAVLPQPVLPGQITCMAYFQGYYFDPTTGSCRKGAQSGCSNPFPFQTLAECQFSIR